MVWPSGRSTTARSVFWLRSRHDHAVLDFRLSLPREWHETSHDARVPCA
jgi:hypothetical protein